MKKPDFDYYRKVVSTQHDPDILQSELKDLINESVAYIEKDDGSKVPCSAGLDAMLEVVKDIRKSDCGGWLKDCNGLFNCRDGREKRNELMRLLDKLYKAASI